MQGLVELEALLTLQLADQRVLLSVAEHRQLAQARARGIDQADQQLLPVLSHAGDARLVEQVTAVGQAAAQATVRSVTSGKGRIWSHWRR